MRKYQLFVIGACAAVALGAAGCGAKTDAAVTTQTAAVTEASSAETSAEVETVEGTIEGMEESAPAAVSQPIRIYGTIKHLEDGNISIDNQSGQGYSGEITLNISDEYTRVLDAATGNPDSLENLKDGDTIYVYISQAMTMSLPPMTNAEVILCNIPADFKVPDYVKVKSVVTDAAASKTVLTSEDGTAYELAPDCSIFPYLTKNIVTIDDLTQGRTCMIWSNDQNVTEKIMVFPE